MGVIYSEATQTMTTNLMFNLIFSSNACKMEHIEVGFVLDSCLTGVIPADQNKTANPFIAPSGFAFRNSGITPF